MASPEAVAVTPVISVCACAVDARRDQVYLQGYDNPHLAEPQVFALDDLPAFDGPLIGTGGVAPQFKLAEAIAFITAQRFRTETTRPAPLYLRPPDAAPARDAAPRILS